MLKRIVLPTETINILRRYGELNDVVNKILALAEQGELPIANIQCDTISCYKTSKITVHISNQWYIDLLLENTYETKPSLSKLLQYFVENNLYDVFNWPIVRFNADIIDVLNQAMNKLCIAASKSITYRDDIYGIINNIVTIMEKLENEHSISDQ